jgi:hypothetical protein
VVGRQKVANPVKAQVLKSQGSGFVGPSMGKAAPAVAETATVMGGAAPAAGRGKLWEGVLGKAGTGPLKGAFRGVGGALTAIGLISTAHQLYDEAVRKPAIRKNPLSYRDPLTGEGYPAYAARLAAESGITPRPLDYLRYRTEAQERLSQRKAVLFSQEPNLSQQLIATLAGEREDNSPLTRTEVMIGAPTPVRQAGPTKRGVETMLDRLLAELD